MKLIASIALLAFAVVAFAAPQKPQKMKWILADGAPAILQKVIDDQPSLRDAKIKLLEEKLKDLRAILKKTKSSRDAQNIHASIKSVEAEIRSIKSDSVIVVPEHLPGSVGMAGMIKSMRVNQVIGESEAIVTMLQTIETRRSVRTGSGVSSVPDFHTIEVDAWASGFDTSRWSDSQHVDVSSSGPLLSYCDSTRTYETTGGSSRTLPEIKPFSMSAFQRVPAQE